jgi:hypothetical protein
MKILWITNIMLPPICKEMGMPLAASGGWMVASALKLSQREGVELAVATVYGGAKLIDKTIDGVRYFLLPLHGKSNIKYNPNLRQYWREVYDRFITLLSLLGLEDRIINEDKDVFSVLDKKFNWEEIDSKLELFRKEGEWFLRL